jgi:hypothetical protein
MTIGKLNSNIYLIEVENNNPKNSIRHKYYILSPDHHSAGNTAKNLFFKEHGGLGIVTNASRIIALSEMEIFLDSDSLVDIVS